MSCYQSTLEETVESLERELQACRERCSMLREVFEAARKLCGYREGCSYDVVIEELRLLTSSKIPVRPTSIRAMIEGES